MRFVVAVSNTCRCFRTQARSPAYIYIYIYQRCSVSCLPCRVDNASICRASCRVWMSRVACHASRVGACQTFARVGACRVGACRVLRVSRVGTCWRHRVSGRVVSGRVVSHACRRMHVYFSRGSQKSKLIFAEVCANIYIYIYIYIYSNYAFA